MAATQSNGAAQPLPCLPLINPLAISMILVLFSIFHWWRRFSKELLGLQEIPGFLPVTFVGTTLFLILTTEVFRAAHH
ncbi:MAG: hypothetical protein KZQ59_05640 [Candidatus Thiodiazotropha sp. (ex Lucinoma aequizonata)]|nr:hypothetical protein [Candidatus Thiodiazotropha sp. (ex Lucinoma aequizonata)]